MHHWIVSPWFGGELDKNLMWHQRWFPASTAPNDTCFSGRSWNISTAMAVILDQPDATPNHPSHSTISTHFGIETDFSTYWKPLVLGFPHGDENWGSVAGAGSGGYWAQPLFHQSPSGPRGRRGSSPLPPKAAASAQSAVSPPKVSATCRHELASTKELKRGPYRASCSSIRRWDVTWHGRFSCRIPNFDP